MARRKKRAEPEYDPSAGEFRNLSPPAPRSEAELRALRRLLGVEHPTPGVDTAPEPRDHVAVLLAQLAARPEPGPVGGGWSGPLFHRVPWKMVGRGENRRWRYVWMPATGIVVALFGVWAADRVALAAYNGFVGGFSSLVGAQFTPASPLAFPTWIGQQLSIGSWIAALQAAVGGAVGSLPTTGPGTGIPTSYPNGPLNLNDPTQATNPTGFPLQCPSGFTLMVAPGGNAFGPFVCVSNTWISTYANAGYTRAT